MQIKNIHLKNFRGMEDLTVEFAPKVNIIIGDNGTGKSSLLKGLKILLSSILEGDENIVQAQILKEDVRMTSSIVGDATTASQYHYPSSVEGDIELNNIVSHCKSKYENENSDPFTDNLSLIWDDESKASEHIKQLLNDKNSKLPLINYQSDQKNLSTSPNDEQKISRVALERRQGYENALTGIYTEDTISNWCLQMELRNLQERKKIAEYETFKKVIIGFIKNVENKELNGSIYFASDMWTLVYYDGKSRQPLYNLSSGYHNLLCMIMELAYRAVLLNPVLNDFKELEGVVLIDEIDMHLHPKWQWRVIGALQGTFPNIQFIVATHSPMIISSAKEARLIKMINPNKIEYLTSAYAYNIDDVLVFRQGSTALPEEAKKLEDELENCINEGDFTNAEKIIQKAIEMFGESSSPVKNMKDTLEVNKWIEEAE